VVNINDVLDVHASLELECVDRLYLNAYARAAQSAMPLIMVLCADK
jgi:hypothetical protein